MAGLGEEGRGVIGVVREYGCSRENLDLPILYPPFDPVVCVWKVSRET